MARTGTDLRETTTGDTVLGDDSGAEAADGEGLRGGESMEVTRAPRLPDHKVTRLHID
jgi:hypothetical protein